MRNSVPSTAIYRAVLRVGPGHHDRAHRRYPRGAHQRHVYGRPGNQADVAGDLLNLTLTAGDINSAKSNLDAFDWLPEKNQCWFARRVVDVKLKYGMTVDRDEADALEGVLSGCESTALIKEACEQ